MIKSVVNILMGLLYAGIGAFIYERNWFFTELDAWAGKSLGIITIAYGLYRIYRAVRAIMAGNA